MFRLLRMIETVHILFILAFSFVRWSLPVTRKYQSGNWSCSTQFAGVAVPMASTAAGPFARCALRRSSRTVTCSAMVAMVAGRLEGRVLALPENQLLLLYTIYMRRTKPFINS